MYIKRIIKQKPVQELLPEKLEATAGPNYSKKYFTLQEEIQKSFIETQTS